MSASSFVNEQKTRCPHCDDSVSVAAVQRVNILQAWLATSAMCPSCSGAIIALDKPSDARLTPFFAYPPTVGKRPKRFPDLPDERFSQRLQEYAEACAIIDSSPRAASALARRSLQAMLHDHGYSASNLFKQVTAVISEKDADKILPIYIRDSFDAIRQYGNFSAHPIEDKQTGAVIDVEAGEAEWCIELVELLLEHYYVKPAVEAARRAALQQKLHAAGAKPMLTSDKEGD